MAPTKKPILFHYPPSIYSHRVLWYLWLRGIEYDECIQPPVMPRPDLASISVGYRKIPILAIGKDVYCDSRLIVSKLEDMFPHSTLTASTKAEEGIRKLFENFSVDGGIFANVVKLMPYWSDFGLMQDKAFLDDRQKLSGGRRMTKEVMEAGRPDGLQNIRHVFELFETTFLADGRDWILGTKTPTVADVDAVWPFEWMIVDPHMKDSLPEQYVNDKVYPKVYAWVRRFMDVVEDRKKACAKPTKLNGEIMASRVMSATSPTDDIGFINDDPLIFKRGDEVQIYPSDYGQMGVSIGSLVGLSTNEVVIENDKGLRLHFPRWNFSIKKISRNIEKVSTPKVPKMRLIYHHQSPFTRKVFMFAHEVGLAKYITLQKVVVCPVTIAGWSDNNDDVSVFNPMTKIPCLVSDDVPDSIYDSTVICEYLEHLVSMRRTKDARHWQLRTLHACADGIMDAAVLITYEVRIRKERNLYFDEWVEGQKQKIIRGLDRLEVAAKSGILPDPSAAPASADEVAVAVATALTAQLGHLGIDWKGGRPELEQWMKKWEGRPSFVDTPPMKEWVVGSDAKTASKI
jgi:glutathione S-transferase